MTNQEVCPKALSVNRLKEHHIWCNRFMQPREGCKMCEDFYKRYPIDDMSQEEAMAKYFPGNVIIDQRKIKDKV